MHDLPPIEGRLSAALRRYADSSIRPHDARSITRTASSHAGWPTLGWGRTVPLALGLGLLLVLMLATLASVGQRSLSTETFPLGSIAFVRNGDLYVAAPDGSDPVLFASGDLGNGEWIDRYAFAPDRSSLALTRGTGDEAGRAELSIMAADGHLFGSLWGGVTPYGFSFGWAPDSRRLAVQSDDEQGYITIVGRDGGRLDTIALPDGTGIHHGARVFPMLPWSPDGRWIAVSANGPAQPECGTGQMGTCYLLLATDGSGSRWLTTSDSNWLEWGPDSHVAVGHWRGGVDISAEDGSALTTVRLPDDLTPADGERTLAWSPNGTRLAVVGSASVANSPDPSYRLVVVDRDGAARVVPGIKTNVHEVAWSTDGLRLEFSGDLMPGGDLPRATLWSVDPADGDPVELIDDGFGFVLADGTP